MLDIVCIFLKGNWSSEGNIAAHQIPVEHPVGMEVMDPIQNLIQERLHHPSRQLHWLLVGLRSTVELDDVLRGRETFHLICTCVKVCLVNLANDSLVTSVLKFYEINPVAAGGIEMAT